MAADLRGDLLGAAADLKASVGVFAGPVAWTTQLLLAYPIAQLTCHAGFAVQHPALLHTISAVALIAVIAAGRMAWGVWKSSDPPRARFTGLLGLLMCGVFALMVVATWLPPFIMRNCEA
jgi:hypothetical protein